MKVMNTIAAIKSTRKGHAKNKTKDKRIPPNWYHSCKNKEKEKYITKN